MANIPTILTANDTEIRQKTAPGSITPDNEADRLDAITTEVRDRGVVFVLNTTVLQQQRMDNTRLVLVQGVGLFAWFAVATPNGTTVFPAADSGYWVLVLQSVEIDGGGGGTPTLGGVTGLTVTPGNTTLVLNWDDLAGATGYIVERALDAGFTSGLSTTTIATPTSAATLTGLVNGTLYYIRVRGTAAGYNPGAWANGSGTPAGAVALDRVYIGAKGSPGLPNEAQILAGNFTDVNAANDVAADWRALTAGGPLHCWYFIPAPTAAHVKNKWFGNVLNNGNIGNPGDLFEQTSTITVGGVLGVMGVTAYATQFSEIIQLQKI